MFRSQNIQVFVFSAIPWFTKSVTSWSVLVHETGYIFELQLKGEWVKIKNDKCELLKMPRSSYIVIFMKS